MFTTGRLESALCEGGANILNAIVTVQHDSVSDPLLSELVARHQMTDRPTLSAPEVVGEGENLCL
jgi:hypothetical protein